MGTRSRPRPARLAGKLLEIRKRLGLTQDELVERLGLEGEFDQERISKFERGKLEPPLHVLCAYCDLANLILDVLARDDVALPKELPARSKLASVPREFTGRRGGESTGAKRRADGAAPRKGSVSDEE